MTRLLAEIDQIARDLTRELEQVAPVQGFAEAIAPRPAPSQPGDADWVPCPGPAIVLDRFGFDSIKPTPAHSAIIQQVARRIFDSRNDSIPVHFVCIEGHTDPSGNKAYNQGLGKRRAESVQQQLIKALDGIQPGLSRSGQFGMWAISAGADAPVVGPSGDQALNRRVNIYLNQRARTQPPATQGRIPPPIPQSLSPRSTVALTQQLLNRAVGARLPVNGSIGPGTQSAVAAFQRGRGLAPSGTITPATINALVGQFGPRLVAVAAATRPNSGGGRS
jgi:outer membrane protein OmpA-like peptidoglycan-associated protein